ncbi:MAG: hypothetical protein ACD_42C00537G0004, partial [uncultured bacterium]
KIAEFEAFFKEIPIEWIPQSQLSIPDVAETGATFIENAILKARHATTLSGLPAVADDSGLVVDALDGNPGVFSSRYAKNDAERIQKLLHELKNVPEKERNACYHSVLVLLEHENDPVPVICHGIWEGKITNEPRGKNGFGYDPIFYVPTHHKTAAELTTTEKNRISHRGQSMQQLLDLLNNDLDAPIE